MKIGIVFPRFKTFSGAEHLALGFSRHAVDRGHQVTIATRAFSEHCRAYLAPEVELKTLHALSFRTGAHLVDSMLDVCLSPLLLRLLPKDIDVICFVADPVLPALWFYKRALRGRTPSVYYCLQPPRFAYDLMKETRAAHKPLGYLIPLVAAPYRWMDRIAARAADQIFAISRDYQEWCEKLYRSSVQLLYPGVELDKSRHANPASVRERHEFAQDTKLVLTVNKLIARKGLDIFLRAMALVVGRIPNSKAFIVGDGPIKRSLLKLREDLGLSDQVIFTGFLPHVEDVMDYYAACDVYVFLERNVPFGLTVVEASAAGRPVVAVRGGGTRDTVVDGETGFLVAENLDIEEVSDRICWLLENEANRARMGRKAAHHAKRFSMFCTADSFVEALSIVAGRPGTR